MAKTTTQSKPEPQAPPASTAVTTATAQQPSPTGLAKVKQTLESPQMKQAFERVLGDAKKANAFVSSIISATSANKDLTYCNPVELAQAGMIAATLNLPINSSLGFACIVPYEGKPQFQIMAKGFIQLAMRSGQYKTINVAPVYKGQIKSRNSITGEMEFQEVPEADMIAANVIGYCGYFKLLNGFEKYFYMTTEQVIAHGKKYSAAYKRGKGPWVDNPEGMREKTVVKLLISKWGVLSVEMQSAMETDSGFVKADGSVTFDDNDTPQTETKITVEEPSLGKNKKAVAPVQEAEHSDVVEPEPAANSDPEGAGYGPDQEAY